MPGPYSIFATDWRGMTDAPVGRRTLPGARKAAAKFCTTAWAKSVEIRVGTQRPGQRSDLPDHLRSRHPELKGPVAVGRHRGVPEPAAMSTGAAPSPCSPSARR